MEDLLNLFRNFPFGRAILLALVTVSYGMALNWIFGRQRRRREGRRDAMLKVVTNGLENGALINLGDVVNVYKGIMRLPSDDLAYRAGLSGFLREYLVELVSGRVTATQSPDRVKEWKPLVTQWLEENEKSAPFADVPEVERHLVADIAGFLEANDKDAVRRKLDQLASSVTVREQDYQRIRELNRWSVPLAAIGLAMTILFGIMALLK